MLAVVVYRHGITDDLKALIQGAVVLAISPFLSIVDQPENLPCIAVWPDVLTAPLAAGGFLVQAGTTQQGTIKFRQIFRRIQAAAGAAENKIF